MREPVLTLIKETLSDGQEVSIRVGGNCMKPVIRSGALVTIKGVPSCCEGEIVAYSIGNNVKVHRIIAKSSQTLFIGSDSSNPGIHEVLRSHVIGKVVKIDNPTRLQNLMYKLKKMARVTT